MASVAAKAEPDLTTANLTRDTARRLNVLAAHHGMSRVQLIEWLTLKAYEEEGLPEPRPLTEATDH